MDVNDPITVPLRLAGVGEQENGALLSSIVVGPVCTQVNVTMFGVELISQFEVPEVSFPVPLAKNAIFVKHPSCPQLNPGIRQ